MAITKSSIIYPIIFTLLIVPILKIIKDLGIFDEFDHKNAKFSKIEQDCKFLDTDLMGPEDFTKLTEDILIVTQDWRLDRSNFDYKSGSLKLVYLKDMTVVEPKIENWPFKKVFHPQGLYYDQKNFMLYVINHPKDNTQDRVEIFNISFDQKDKNIVNISYKYDIQMPVELNGIAMDLISPEKDTFFITKMYANPAPIQTEEQTKSYYKMANYIDFTMDYQKSFVYYCIVPSGQCSQKIKNMECQMLPQTFSTMNKGIEWDRRNKVLVSNTKDKSISAYELDLKSPEKLKFRNKFYVNGHPNNIEFDRFDGNFYTAGYMRLMEIFTILAYGPETAQQFLDQQERDSWNFADQIIIKPVNYQFEVKNLIATNDANVYSTIASVYNDSLILGSWIDKSLVICKPKN